MRAPRPGIHRRVRRRPGSHAEGRDHRARQRQLFGRQCREVLRRDRVGVAPGSKNRDGSYRFVCPPSRAPILPRYGATASSRRKTPRRRGRILESLRGGELAEFDTCETPRRVSRGRSAGGPARRRSGVRCGLAGRAPAAPRRSRSGFRERYRAAWAISSASLVPRIASMSSRDFSRTPSVSSAAAASSASRSSATSADTQSSVSDTPGSL